MHRGCVSKQKLHSGWTRNGASRETTDTDDDPEVPEPVDTTQATTDTDESQELHSLMIKLNETFTDTVNKLKQ